MNDSLCPSTSLLTAFLDGELSQQEQRAVREHTGACTDCQLWLASSEPTRVFSALTEPVHNELPEELWPAVWRAVEAEIQTPQRSWLSGWLPQARPLDWLAPAVVCLGVVFVLVGLLPSAPLPGPARSLAQTQPAVGPVVEKAAASEFVYLTNPEAQITHFLLQDEQQVGIQLTMVVDSRFEDAF